MERHVALLRAVNLGSYGKVGMAALRDALAGAGYEDARTYLQSGNVVLSADASPDEVERRLESIIESAFGFTTTVIVRSRDELAAVVERDPLGDVADNPSRYLVSFLAGDPAPDVARRIGELDVAPERLVVAGREIYAWLPDGVQRSRAMKELAERRIGVAATARNWNTVRALLRMAGE
jgi:uncharacterized protein (DUF1697 family)